MLYHTNYKNSLSKFGYCIYTNIAEIHICTNNKYIAKDENTLNSVSNVDTSVKISLYFDGIMEHSSGKTLLECSTDGFVHSKTQLLLAAQ